MTSSKLTTSARNIHKKRMKRPGHAKRLIAMLGVIPVAGCVQLEAPTEPIVIELNINITQEVIYRLAEDAGNTIDENADIF